LGFDGGGGIFEQIDKSDGFDSGYRK